MILLDVTRKRSKADLNEDHDKTMIIIMTPHATAMPSRPRHIEAESLLKILLTPYITLVLRASCQYSRDRRTEGAY